MIADLLRPALPVFGCGKRCYARLMPGWIGPWELAILLIVVLLVFGPKRLPEMGRSLGKGMREFKNSITGKDDDRHELRPGEEITLVEHLGELRTRLAVCMLAVLFCFIFTYIFRAHLLDWLNRPLP